MRHFLSYLPFTKMHLRIQIQPGLPLGLYVTPDLTNVETQNYLQVSSLLLFGSGFITWIFELGYNTSDLF